MKEEVLIYISNLHPYSVDVKAETLMMDVYPSPLSQGAMGGGRLKESGKLCSWSRHRCLFIVLVLATVLYFYNTNMNMTQI